MIEAKLFYARCSLAMGRPRAASPHAQLNDNRPRPPAANGVFGDHHRVIATLSCLDSPLFSATGPLISHRSWYPAILLASAAKSTIPMCPSGRTTYAEFLRNPAPFVAALQGNT